MGGRAARRFKREAFEAMKARYELSCPKLPRRKPR